MRFERALELLISVVALLGFIALTLPGDLELPWALLMLLGWAGSLGTYRRSLVSERLWQLSTIAFLVYVAGYYFYVSGNGMVIARQLLIFLQLNRLYVRKSYRDYAYIFLLSFLQILLGCLLTVSPTFALVLLLFLLCAGWGLMLLQMKIGMDQQAESELPDRRDAAPQKYMAGDELISSRFIGYSVAMTLIMLGITLVVFLFVPRIQMGLMRRMGNSSIHIAGFSETVQLGEVGDIQQGNQRVMRVWVGGNVQALGREPYWRGVALDEFDGVSWRQAGNWNDSQRTLPPRVINDLLPQGANLQQDYVLENIDSSVLFAVPTVKAFEASLGRVAHDYTDSYSTDEKVDHLEYTVYSRIELPNPEKLRTEQSVLPKRLMQIYLQTPEMAPEVSALAKRITMGDDNNYDRSVSIQNYLRDNFEYTLNPQSTGRAPVEDFLFRTRAGHCEYFASSMVLLVRTLGIPARIVNGFAGGDFNSVGGYYVVRQRDAHSWVEIWFNGSGWIRFDPTPAIAVQNSVDETQSAFGRAQEYVDYLEMRWYSLLDYDVQDQLELVTGLLTSDTDSEGNDIEQETRQYAHDLRRWLGWLAWPAAVLLMGVLGWFYRRQTRVRAAHIPPHLTTQQAKEFISLRRRINRRLAQLGVERFPSETPMERAIRAEAAFKLLPILQSVEAQYYAAFYGGVAVDENAVQCASNALKAVEKLRPIQVS